jgi:hypothetical protein
VICQESGSGYGIVRTPLTLPDLTDSATEAMGFGDISSGATLGAFAKDVLSIEICGPDHLQLTLVYHARAETSRIPTNK